MPHFNSRIKSIVMLHLMSMTFLSLAINLNLTLTYVSPLSVTLSKVYFTVSSTLSEREILNYTFSSLSMRTFPGDSQNILQRVMLHIPELDSGIRWNFPFILYGPCSVT